MTTATAKTWAYMVGQYEYFEGVKKTIFLPYKIDGKLMKPVSKKEADTLASELGSGYCVKRTKVA